MADKNRISLTLIRSWVWNTTERVEAFVVACWTAPAGLILVYKKDLKPMFLEESSETKATDGLTIPSMGSGPVSYHKHSVFSKLGAQALNKFLLKYTERRNLRKRGYIIMVCDGMSIEYTENGRLFRSGLKEAAKVFYGYGAAWMLRKGLLNLNQDGAGAGAWARSRELVAESFSGVLQIIEVNMLYHCKPPP